MQYKSPASCLAEELRAFWTHREEFTVMSDVLLWQLRDVIPITIRNKVRKHFHKTRIGFIWNEQLTRSYVWWPGIDENIERIFQSCSTCITNVRKPQKPTIERWDDTWQPLQVHVVYENLFISKSWSSLIVAFTKFVGVHRVSYLHFTTTVGCYKKIFS